MLWMMQSPITAHPMSASLLIQVEQSTPRIQPIGMCSLKRVIQEPQVQVVQPDLQVPEDQQDLLVVLVPQEQQVLKG